MKPEVWIARGGSALKGPGRRRWVKGVITEVFVRLAEEDPDDISGWRHVGQIGHWSPSAIRQRAPSERRPRRSAR